MTLVQQGVMAGKEVTEVAEEAGKAVETHLAKVELAAAVLAAELG